MAKAKGRNDPIALKSRKGLDEVADVDETDIIVQETMRAGVHRARKRTLLEQWAEDGQISRSMKEAGLRFESDFEKAHLRDRYGSVLKERVSGSPKQTDGYVVDVLNARRRVEKVRGALGRIAFDVLWDVLGNGMSLREHANRQLWNSKPINSHQAKGRLITALDVLTAFYGLEV